VLFLHFLRKCLVGMKYLIFLIIIIAISINGFSQNFVTVGNAYGIPLIQGDACLEADTCFTLTDALNTQAGAVWEEGAIDLSSSFDATFCLFLGSNDADGADGFAFVLRGPNSIDLGGVGQGIGFGDYNETPEDDGIIPSVAIEYDTWDNGAVANDIPDDHTGLFYNGDQTVAIAPVVPLIGNSINAEDGQYHTTRIVWDAVQSNLKMYFDGVLLIDSTDDLINEVFNGNSEVIWGFTSSTGGANNLHQICFPEVSIETQEFLACEGETVEFSYYTEGITNYQWSNDDGDILVDWSIEDGTVLVDTLISTTEPGTFYLDFEFNNITISDSVLVNFVQNPISPFNEVFLELCPEEEFPLFLDAQNTGSSYLWNTDENDQVINATLEQMYTVLITEPVLGCTTEDSIEISHYCEPLAFLPNVFSPDADTLNRYFEPISFKYVGDFSMNIFNRWGAIIHSTNSRIRWNGTDENQNPVKDGVYYYTLMYEGEKGRVSNELSGTITLLRKN